MNISKLEEKIKKKDLARNFAWINTQQAKGRLTLGGVKMSPTVFEIFRRAVKNTNEIYEDTWDFEYSVTIREEVIKGKTKRVIKVDIQSILIHFPVINITNTQKHKHQIVDLFVRTIFQVRDNGQLMIRDTQGTRMQVSYAEYSSNYFHSHLNASMTQPGNRLSWGSFCTGSGEINAAIAEVNGDGFRDEDYIKYLLYLTTLVSWESIEGTPYRSIKNIFPRFQNARQFSSQPRDAINLYQSIVKKHKEDEKVPDLNFILETGRFRLKDDESFDKFLMYVPFNDRQKQQYFCRKDESGTYWQYGSSMRYQLPTGTYRPILWFRGQHLTFTITGIEQEKKGDEPEWSLHPDMKKTIKEEIEYEINRKTIRQSTINRYTNKAGDARESVESDKVLV